ncbi:unnamed protein product [Acanthoscelides obtectus]|uniref:BHLH domain-containing protein n=1 Tax=Acanthoscelides obtectus TaxID=200917 RepID=A0A9P0M216_ACAOB|nr:unnamed protein product [Acanthoscelides obtectus]CAK1651262.1 hypothetical protein AOBTE_LOCUS17139 [Acanthoscelides obtectus]
MPRSSKCREWEKERRNRFNEALTSLAKVLPNYDPTVNLAKLDILHKAKTTIVELQAQVATTGDAEEKEVVKNNLIKKFQNRIRVLLSRNEQLGNLLKDAKITIPKHLEPIKLKKSLPWSGRIKSEQAEYFQKKEMEKENVTQSNHIHTRIRCIKKPPKKTKTQSCKKNSINKAAVGPKCVLVLPQTKYGDGSRRQRCSIAPSKYSDVTSIPKPVCISANALSTLGPGTLIFPNGTALPLVSQSPICFPPTVTFLANPVPTLQLTTAKALQKVPQLKQTIGVRKLTRPIISNICLTTTTQVNKVPIPALSTNYTNTVLLKSAQKTVTKSISESNKKCFKRKAVDVSTESSKKVKSDATHTDNNATVKGISVTDSTSGCSNNCNNNTDIEKSQNIETVAVTKALSESCNIDVNKGKILEIKANSCDVPVTSSDKLIDKQSQVSDLQPNNLNILKDTQVMVNSQSVIGGESDVIGKNSELLPATNVRKLETDTRNASLENNDISSAEGSIKPIASGAKDITQNGVTQDAKTDHTHCELSNDIFGALAAGASCQNPESTSPTAAFLMTFPLVSSVKATEVTDEENAEGHDAENLLQTHNIDANKTSLPDNLANSLLNLDTFSFFSCSNFLSKCSTALGNETASNSITLSTVKSPILQTDFSVIVSKDQEEIKKPAANENKSSQQIQCLDGHEKHSNTTKDAALVEKSASVKPDKPADFGLSNQNVADKHKENTYNLFGRNNTDIKNRSKLLPYHEPMQNSSHLDIKCIGASNNKIKMGTVDVNSSEKSTSNGVSTPNLHEQSSKDLSIYYNDLSGLNVNNKETNHSIVASNGNKNASSGKSHDDTAGKNTNFNNSPFLSHNVFEQSVKDCYAGKTNDNLESRGIIESSQVSQVLPNVGSYTYANNWNLPKSDHKLSGEKNSIFYLQSGQIALKSSYGCNVPDSIKYTNLVESHPKVTVSQIHSQNESNISKSTTYNNPDKSDTKQIKPQENIQISTKTLYDFSSSEAMTYIDPARSNMSFCADKNTFSVSQQPMFDSAKYNTNVSGNKSNVPSNQASQHSSKPTYGFNASDSTTYLYPTNTYNSKSLGNVKESYLVQNMPAISKPSREYSILPTNGGFGSNHFDKITSSFCSMRGTSATETFALNSTSEPNKFPEVRGSRLQASAVQVDSCSTNQHNIHCANIFEDKNVAASKQAPGQRENRLQYPLKTSDFGQGHLYNYQQVTGSQRKSDNNAQMTDVMYQESISSVNNRLSNNSNQNLYDKKQSSHGYHERASSKDDKPGTSNQDMYGKKHTMSRDKHNSKNTSDDILKQPNHGFHQHDTCYKGKTKTVPDIRSMGKATNDIFSPQTSIDAGNQSNKDINQISQLYMMNLPTGSCHYQTEDTKTSSYMNINKTYSGALYTNSTNYSKYNYTTDISLNENCHKPTTSKPFVQDKLLEAAPNLDTNKYCVSPVKKIGIELKTNPFNPPVNWMTTADSKTECFLPQFSTPSYTSASTEDAKQYTWSTNKFPNIFEAPQAFVPHSVPSLPFNPSSLIEHQKPPKEKKTVHPENQSNFLSVSQLVDQNKSDCTATPAKVTARRNSGNRSKSTNISKNKRSIKTESVDKSAQSKQTSGLVVNNEYCYDQKQTIKNRNSTSYSAEALIGNQGNEFSKKYVPVESKSLVTNNFLADSMVTYFPPMDDNYISHNNFSTNNFSHNSLQSTSYSANNFLYSTQSVAPTHVHTNAFENPPDFLTESIADMKDLNAKQSKFFAKDEKNPSCSSSGAKKSKKKQTNDSTFEATFPPINDTSMLNEDFLHNTFLAPTTPYPCKTTLCQKQSNEFNTNSLLPLPGLPRSFGQSIESSSSLNTTGTSLTNFNLSTIFPEINKASFSSENKYNFNT